MHICTPNAMSLINFLLFISRWKTVFENYCHVLNLSCWRNPCYRKELCSQTFVMGKFRKNKVLLRELPEFCVLMFFKSLSILQKKKSFLHWFSPVVHTRDLRMFVNVQVSKFLQLITATCCWTIVYRVKGRSE